MYQVLECSFQAAVSGMILGSLCSNSADLGRPSGQSRCCNSPQPPDGPLLQGLPPTSEMTLVVGWGLAPGHSPQPQPFPGALKWLFPYDPVCACCVFRHQRGEPAREKAPKSAVQASCRTAMPTLRTQAPETSWKFFLMPVCKGGQGERPSYTPSDKKHKPNQGAPPTCI